MPRLLSHGLQPIKKLIFQRKDIINDGHMVRWACESLGATQMASEPRNVSLTRRLLEYSKSRNISWEFLRKRFNYLTAPHKRRKIKSTYGDGTVHDSGFCSHGDNFTNARDAEQMRLRSRSVRSLHLKKINADIQYFL